MKCIDKSDQVNEMKVHLVRLLKELKFIHESCGEIEDLYKGLIIDIEKVGDMLDDYHQTKPPGTARRDFESSRARTLECYLEDLQMAHAELEVTFDRLLLCRALGTAYIEHELQKLSKKSTKTH